MCGNDHWINLQLSQTVGPIELQPEEIRVCHNHLKQPQQKMGWNPQKSPRLSCYLAIFRVFVLSMVTVGADMVDHRKSMVTFFSCRKRASQQLEDPLVRMTRVAWSRIRTPLIQTRALIINTTVDGWNPAPVARQFFPIIYRVSAPSQVVVWDFSHQPYHNHIVPVAILWNLC